MESPQKVYRTYNKRYFGGRLPDIPCRWGETVKGHAAEYWPEGSEGGAKILIHPCVRITGMDKYMRMLVLHEQVHVELRNEKCEDHGYKFQRRIKELVSLGAYTRLL